ncbi:MAG: hypothetical protein ACYDBB_22830 [Armatimonadota bacterium]
MEIVTKRPGWWRRRGVWVLLVLVLAGGGWWWLMPSRLHVVGRYPGAAVVCASGYYVDGTLYDWRGLPVWRVAASLPPPQISPQWQARSPLLFRQSASQPSGVTVALSPHGEYLARAIAVQRQTRVQIFRHGTCIGTHLLPINLPINQNNFLGYAVPKLCVLDDGTVWVTVYTPLRLKMFSSFSTLALPTVPAFVLRGDRIIATGSLPSICLLAPDARFALVMKYQAHYVRLSVQQGRIQQTELFSIKSATLPMWDLEMADLFTGGALITRDGALYRSSGLVPGSTYALDHMRQYATYAVSPGLRTAQIFCPATGDAWRCQFRGMALAGRATDDGRFAALHVRRFPNATMRRVMRSLHGPLPKVVPDPNTYALDYLLLFERPGRLRAVYILPTPDRSPECIPYPSADGQAVYYQRQPANNLSVYECVLLRR